MPFVQEEVLSLAQKPYDPTSSSYSEKQNQRFRRTFSGMLVRELFLGYPTQRLLRAPRSGSAVHSEGRMRVRLCGIVAPVAHLSIARPSSSFHLTQGPAVTGWIRRSDSRTQAFSSGLMSMAAAGLVKNVVVIVAMEAEAAPLIERLGLVENRDKFSAAAPSKCFSGVYQGAAVNVVTNGKCGRFGVDQIGTVAAGLSTWLSVETLKPDLVINAGTAGGFKKHDTAIGDVFVSTRIRNHDRRIPIPGFKEFGVGDHESHPTPLLLQRLGFKQGVVTTGSSFDHTEMDDAMMEENDAKVKDMEAAAVAWACEQHGTPLFCVKVVTDIVDGGGVGEDEFLQNLQAASESLQDAMPKVLDFVLDRPLADL